MLILPLLLYLLLGYNLLEIAPQRLPPKSYSPLSSLALKKAFLPLKKIYGEKKKKESSA